MEPESHQQQNQHHPNGNCGGSGRANCPCRQTCPRWTPTSEQIRILKELYYNNGIRSPTADQIQKISARLREYGKIEGKNVFYWFQNYKARERLKKKIEGTNSIDAPMQRGGGTGWKPEDHDSKTQSQSQKITSAGVSAPSQSVLVYTVGQMADYGYGSVSMEKSFRDCSISSSGGSSRTQNIRWFGIDPHPSSYIYFGNSQPVDEEEEQESSPEIETLPLFPLHGEDNINTAYDYINPSNSSYYSGSWYGSDDGSSSTSSASLELSLNSYNGNSSGSM